MKTDVKRVAIEIVALVLLLGIAVPYLFRTAAIGIDKTLGLTPLFSQPVATILAAASFIIGLFWILWSYSYLLYVGQGSPVEVFGRTFSPTKQLVTVGPYAYTRNPMILGYLWILLGMEFYTGSVSGLLMIPLLTLLSVAYLELFEEPGLVRRFGNEYRHYREHVPILIPGWRVYIKPESALQA